MAGTRTTTADWIDSVGAGRMRPAAGETSPINIYVWVHEHKNEGAHGTSLEVSRLDILRPRWVARACFLTADRQYTELPLLRLPRLVPEFRGSGPCVKPET